jgi:hypothetical protein
VRAWEVRARREQAKIRRTRVSPRCPTLTCTWTGSREQSAARAPARVPCPWSVRSSALLSSSAWTPLTQCCGQAVAHHNRRFARACSCLECYRANNWREQARPFGLTVRGVCSRSRMLLAARLARAISAFSAPLLVRQRLEPRQPVVRRRRVSKPRRRCHVRARTAARGGG